jgi:hypothetical protein
LIDLGNALAGPLAMRGHGRGAILGLDGPEDEADTNDQKSVSESYA